MRAGQQHLKEQMLAKMETNQERIKVNQENIDIKIEGNQEKMEMEWKQMLKTVFSNRFQSTYLLVLGVALHTLF
jgi:2C-methyl-D-erythritol 2,4-cyclodiphosphate synthase